MQSVILWMISKVCKYLRDDRCSGERGSGGCKVNHPMIDAWKQITSCEGGRGSITEWEQRKIEGGAVAPVLVLLQSMCSVKEALVGCLLSGSHSRRGLMAVIIYHEANVL